MVFLAIQNSLGGSGRSFSRSHARYHLMYQLLVLYFDAQTRLAGSIPPIIRSRFTPATQVQEIELE